MGELSPKQLAKVEGFLAFLEALENDTLREEVMRRLRERVCPYCGDLNDTHNYCIRDD